MKITNYDFIKKHAELVTKIFDFYDMKWFPRESVERVLLFPSKYNLNNGISKEKMQNELIIEYHDINNELTIEKEVYFIRDMEGTTYYNIRFNFSNGDGELYSLYIRYDIFNKFSILLYKPNTNFDLLHVEFKVNENEDIEFIDDSSYSNMRTSLSIINDIYHLLYYTNIAMKQIDYNKVLEDENVELDTIKNKVDDILGGNKFKVIEDKIKELSRIKSEDMVVFTSEQDIIYDKKERDENYYMHISFNIANKTVTFYPKCNKNTLYSSYASTDFIFDDEYRVKDVRTGRTTIGNDLIWQYINSNNAEENLVYNTIKAIELEIDNQMRWNKLRMGE